MAAGKENCICTFLRVTNHHNRISPATDSRLALHRGFAGFSSPRNEVRPMERKDHRLFPD